MKKIVFIISLLLSCIFSLLVFKKSFVYAMVRDYNCTGSDITTCPPDDDANIVCMGGSCAYLPKTGNPLLEYKENITSKEANLDQWMGGYISETEEGKTTGGVIDSVFKKILTLGVGLPNDNGQMTGGIINVSGVALASLFDRPPASGVTYLADLLDNIGIAKPAYAQGVGFNGLSPVLSLWKATRNFAYILITVLFVVLGLMVMFRVKLSPQSVVSIQSAIPKIAVTLILITFSYAIAGLLIDLGNLVLILVIKMLSGSGLIVNIQATTSQWLNAGIGTVIGRVIANLCNGIIGLAFSKDLLSTTLIGGTVGIAGTVVPLFFAVGTPGLGTAMLMAVVALAAGVIMAIIGLLFKIIIMMIKAYVSIILGVVLGPLQIVFDALPGQKTSAVKSWAKSLFGNILVFPTVAILFILCDVFDNLLSHGNNSGIWAPPGFNGGNAIIMNSIKIGILIIIPNVDKVIMQALDIKTTFSSALGRGELLEKTDRFYKGEVERNLATYRKLGEENLFGRGEPKPGVK